MKTITLTMTAGQFQAECEGVTGAGATRSKAIARLCTAWHDAGRGWLDTGRAVVQGPAPVVGMPATYGIGSDRYAYTVTEVLSAKRIKLARDRDRRGLYLPGEGEPVVATLRKDGRWREVGASCGSFLLGERETHLDPSF